MVILEIFCSFSCYQIQLGNRAPVPKHWKQAVNKVFCLLLFLIDSQAIFVTELKTVPDGFWWRESLPKLLLGEIEEEGEKSKGKEKSPCPYKTAHCPAVLFPDEWWQVKKCDCRSADINKHHPIYLFMKVFMLSVVFCAFFLSKKDFFFFSGCSTQSSPVLKCWLRSRVGSGVC